MIASLRSFGRGAVEEVRSLRRRPLVFVILLGLPVLYPSIISLLYGERQASERPALLVDADGSALSRRLALALEATRNVQIVARPASLEEAFAEVRRQKAELLVYVPEDFSARLKRGEQTAVRLWVNTANMYTYGQAYLDLNAAVLDFDRSLGRDFLQRRGLPRDAAAQRVLPVIFEERPLFAPTANYGDFLVIGVLLIVVQQIVLISLAFSVGWQREEGGAATPPEHAFAQLLGRAATHLLFHLVGVSAIVLGACRAFGWPMQSQAAVWALFAGLAAAMVPPALLVAHFTRDRFLAFQLLMFFSAPVFMMSGFSWPQERMAEPLRALAWIFPATPALQALRVLAFKSGDAAVLLPALEAMGLQAAGWAAITWILVRASAVWRRRAALSPTS